jgi:hypothetical protein
VPRACLICIDANKTRLAAEMVAAGLSDQSVATRLGGLSRGSARRHRVHHIERPAKAIVAAANKGKDVRDERDHLVAAAEAGDVAAAFLSLERIASDLRRVQERLERSADAAEADSQRLAVASLSGQQLRAAEVRAKLGGVGGYATPRNDKANAPPFVLTINFSGGRQTRIEGTPIHSDDPAFNALPTVPLSIGDRDLELSGGEDEDAGSFDQDV